jgi:hypothetical protein
MTWAAAKTVLPALVLATLCGFMLAQSGCGNALGCGGLTGYGNGPFSGCSGGKPIPPQTSVNFEGDVGTAFRATVSDTVASYTFQAAVPLQLVYVNSVPPIRVIATSLSTRPALLSLQALSAFTTTQLASTTRPGGTVSVNVGGSLPALAGPAACDVRFYVYGPPTQNFQSLLEQNNNAYENTTIAPNLFLLGQAKGNVDGIFTEGYGLFGPLKVYLVINGKLADIGAGSNFTVKSGCP